MTVEQGSLRAESTVLSCGSNDKQQGAVMRLIRIKEVIERTGMSRTTIYRLRQQNRFPEAIVLTGTMVAWLEADILAWIQARLLGQEWKPES